MRTVEYDVSYTFQDIDMCRSGISEEYIDVILRELRAEDGVDVSSIVVHKIITIREIVKL